MKLTKKFVNLKDRVLTRIGGDKSDGTGPSTSAQPSIDSASGARDLVQGNNAGQTVQTALGTNAPLNQTVTALSSSDMKLLSTAPSTLGNPMYQATGGSTAGSGYEANLVDHHVLDSNSNLTAKDILKLMWTGMEMVLKRVQPLLDGTPAKAPVAVINMLIEIKNTAGGNKGAVEQLIIQTAERLLALVEALTQGVPESSRPRMKVFIEILWEEIYMLKKISEKGTFRQILENEVDKRAIQDSIKRVEQATKNFQIDIALATEKKVDEILSEIKLAKLERFRAAKAIYNADLGSEVILPREPCTKGTRKGILSDIILWAEDTSLDCPSVFWLTGDAGSGKTTIAYTVAQYFDNPEMSGQHTILGGTFHCSRQFSETRQQVYIIPTIAYELAQKSSSYCYALRDINKFDSVDKLDKQIVDLFAGPWQQSASYRYAGLPPYLIIIDALDEIIDQGGSKFLCKMLETIKQQQLHGLKFLFTSRPDPAVVTLFDPYVFKALYRLQDVPIQDVANDIAKFMQIKLPKLADTELESLVQLADGLFISAATIVRFLTPHPSTTLREQHKLLHKLKHGQAGKGLLIDQLYQQILYDALSSFVGDGFTSRLCILHTFICTSERTSTSVTAALLAELDIDIETVNAVLETLHAVLYYKDSQVLWYHTSFPDFMFDKARSTFFFQGHQFFMACNQPQHHATLGKSCFRIMNLLHFNIGNIPSSFRLDDEDPRLAKRIAANISVSLKYACQYWSDHVIQSDQESSQDFSRLIKGFLKIDVLFWIEAMNLLKTTSRCSTMLQHVHAWILKNTNRELDLAANLDEAGKFAAYFAGNPPSLSTPHLYISSLATWSVESQMCQNWKKRFTGIPSFAHTMTGITPPIIIQTGASTWSAAFSPNGANIVSASDDKSVKIWDASTGVELKVLNGHTNYVRTVAFSPDGTHIVSGSWDKSVRIWDVFTGVELRVLNSHTDVVTSVNFSPDSNHIVSGSWDKSVRIWHATTGAELRVLNGHTDYVRCVAFSPDGTYIVSGSWDKSIRIWDPFTGAKVRVLNGHTGVVRSVAFSLNGTQIVSGSYDKSIRMWDATTGAELRVLNSHAEVVTSVAFSPDGTYFVSGSDDKSVKIWDASTGAELRVFNGHTDYVRSVAFSPDGTHIVSGSNDKSVKIWHASTGAELRVLNSHTEAVRSIAFSPDGTHIVSGSDDKSVKIWDTATRAELKVLSGHTEAVRTVAFSQDGTQIVSGSYDKSVRIWDATTGAELRVLNSHTEVVTSVAFSPDNIHIVSGSNDKSVRIWDASTGAELRVLNGHTDYVRSVAFSPDGTHIVSGSWDKSVRIWHATTGAELRVFNGHTDYVRSVASKFSPDGSYIVSGSDDKSIRIWDVSTGAVLRVLSGHTEAVQSVAISLDGTHIVSGSWDKSVRIWDAITGAELKVLNGHTEVVTSVAFSPDGTHIVSGSDDKSMRIWDASTRSELSVFDDYTDYVRSVAFSPDDTHIVSGTWDNSLQVKNISIPFHNDTALATLTAQSAFLSPIVHQLYPAWTADADQWLFSDYGKYRLMWVPQIAYPFTIFVISQHGSPLVSFYNCDIGPDWVKCYIHD